MGAVGRIERFAERAIRGAHEHAGSSRWAVFAETAREDLDDAGGFLVIGGLTAAALNVVVPRSWLDTLGSQVLLGIVVMAVLAVLLALCSEADAFVAASLTTMPLLPRLVFLVVGPAVDIKLFALQAGTLSRRFALRFAPLTFVVALAARRSPGGDPRTALDRGNEWTGRCHFLTTPARNPPKPPPQAADRSPHSSLIDRWTRSMEHEQQLVEL